MSDNIIYDNSEIIISVDKNKKILFINIIDGNYYKDHFLEALNYYYNFWILVNKTDDLYHQIFIFNNIKLYPLEFFISIFNTLKSLENIFKKNLISSCLINNSNAMDILAPLLNMYQTVRPFKFVKTLNDAFNFINI